MAALQGSHHICCPLLLHGAPDGIESRGGNKATHLLKFLSNLYGQKQAGQIWNQYLVDKLLDAAFSRLLIDDCVFYCGSVIFIICVDDRIFLKHSDEQLMHRIRMLQEMSLPIDDQWYPVDHVVSTLRNYLTGPTYSHNMHSLKLSQKILGCYHPTRSNVCQYAFIKTPSCTQFIQAILQVWKIRFQLPICHWQAQLSCLDFKAYYHLCYSSIIQVLCRSLPRPWHSNDVFRPVSESYQNHWHQVQDPTRQRFWMLCRWWLCSHFQQRILWWESCCSQVSIRMVHLLCRMSNWMGNKLHTIVALITTEAKYIDLSNALCDVIPIMELLQETKSCKFDVISILSYVYCKALKTILERWNLPVYPRCAQGPSTLLSVTINLGNMSVQAKSRYIQLIPKINLQTLLPKYLLQIFLCTITIRYLDNKQVCTERE